MTNTIKHLIFIAVLAVFTSCEGGTTFTKTIDNRSSEVLEVTVYSTYGYNETFSITSSESQQIYWDDQMGSFADDSYSCTQEIDSIALTITNNKILKTDIMNADNWIRESKDGRNSEENCTFIIRDEDLE